MKPIHHLEIGDTIEVHGNHFVLFELKTEVNQPARVVFKQPVELMLTGDIMVENADGVSESVSLAVVPSSIANTPSGRAILNENNERIAAALGYTRPESCPECKAGKHVNCTHVALNADDEMVDCDCKIRGHSSG